MAGTLDWLSNNMKWIGPTAGALGGYFAQKNALGNYEDVLNQNFGQAIGAQNTAFDTVKNLQTPYISAGQTVLPQLLTSDPTAQASKYATQLEGLPQFSYSFSDEDPAYQFKLSEAQKAIDAASAARGNYNSRATINALSDAQQAITADESMRQYERQKDAYNMQYGKIMDLYNMGSAIGLTDFNRLLSVANMGQSATGALSNAAFNTGAGLANTYGNLGSGLGDAALVTGQSQSDLISGLGTLPLNYELMNKLLGDGGNTGTASGSGGANSIPGLASLATKLSGLFGGGTAAASGGGVSGALSGLGIGNPAAYTPAAVGAGAAASGSGVSGALSGLGIGNPAAYTPAASTASGGGALTGTAAAAPFLPAAMIGGMIVKNLLRKENTKPRPEWEVPFFDTLTDAHQQNKGPQWLANQLNQNYDFFKQSGFKDVYGKSYFDIMNDVRWATKSGDALEIELDGDTYRSSSLDDYMAGKGITFNKASGGSALEEQIRKMREADQRRHAMYESMA